jgi:hypothetical protein
MDDIDHFSVIMDATMMLAMALTETHGADRNIQGVYVNRSA